jgi:hypothetical protein
MSFYSGKRGPDELVQTLEAIQTGMTLMLLKQVCSRTARKLHLDHRLSYKGI